MMAQRLQSSDCVALSEALKRVFQHNERLALTLNKQANNYISSPPPRPRHVRAREVQRDLVRVDDATQ